MALLSWLQVVGGGPCSGGKTTDLGPQRITSEEEPRTHRSQSDVVTCAGGVICHIRIPHRAKSERRPSCQRLSETSPRQRPASVFASRGRNLRSGHSHAKLQVTVS
ncbi:hypothetical protein CONLIGDRAFT_278932 [Coniochaeta ligniaria NRRL 30616]|uniref:Uncharacterized protein n=1 Tax=Coniochaeta ligniaria NRRL 30616 TaxID=1408157 RepID=A0A1J7IXD9_9PEZI|nr:hypothetical protein CONLIGDRAFT_278932 [Coniochaeta ligniaria NRRL 30616]